MFQVPRLFNIAYLRAATALTASNGFRKTGIYSANHHILEDHEFAPPATTDMPLPEVAPPLSVTSESNADKFSVECDICHQQFASVKDIITHMHQHAAANEDDNSAKAQKSTDMRPNKLLVTKKQNVPNLEQNVLTDADQSTCCKQSDIAVIQSLDNRTEVSFILPFNISPIPKVGNNRKTLNSSRIGGSAVITSSPYKQQLMQQQSLSTSDKRKSSEVSLLTLTMKKSRDMKSNKPEIKITKKSTQNRRKSKQNSSKQKTSKEKSIDDMTVYIVGNCSVLAEANGFNVKLVLIGLMKVVLMWAKKISCLLVNFADNNF